MPDDHKCPVCGAVIPPEVVDGQCVNCLLSLGLSGASGKVNYFGDYELGGIIAEGGMGIVYRARQVSLNRPVALKMIRAGQFATAAEVERFRAEAEAAANLEHPNIVPICEVGEHEGQQYFSMKLIEGRDLRRRIEDGEFRSATPEGTVSKAVARKTQIRIATLLAKAAHAVHFAHQRQILHRDLKPANILLDERGEPYVVDFGLAKLLGGVPGDTRTRQILGTAEYMSPEQARAEKRLTTGADIYSLGAVLYHLLTGRPPFQADSPLETLQLVMHTEPARPATVNPLVDRDLETICLKCLEKDPNRRYESAAALAEDLELWLAGKPIKARPVGAWERTAKWLRRNPVKTALVAAILLAVVAPVLVAFAYILDFQHILSQHDVRQMHPAGWFHIEIIDESADRCTPNFAKRDFQVPGGRQAKLTFENVPVDWLPRLQVVVMADRPALPDVPSSAPLTNGSVVWLDGGTSWDRNYYFAPKGWSVINLLAHTTNPAIRLEMIPVR
jgi:serine/threonine-protein kinase